MMTILFLAEVPMKSVQTIVIALFASSLVACAGESFVNTSGNGGQAGAGAAGASAGSGGSDAGSGGSGAGAGGSDAGAGGSNAGAGGSDAGAGGSEAGAGGSDAGAGGSDAGAGGSDAGAGGSDAGAGGSDAGAGGSDAGAGGSDAGAGGSDAGAGGSDAGAGGSDAGAGGSDAGAGGSDAGAGGSDAGAGGSDAGAGGSDAGAGGSDAGAGGSDAGAGGSSAGAGGAAGGAAGQGGSAGSGGSPPSCLTGELQCTNNQYCNGDTGACMPCGDMNRFEFTAPEFLQTGMNFAQRSFPRVQFHGETLRMNFRVRGGQDWENYEIARVNDPFVGGTVEDCCINKPAADSGPLPLPAGVTQVQLAQFAPNVGTPPSGTRFILLDSERGFGGFGLNLAEGRRRIFLASRTGQANDFYYEPIQKLNTGAEDYSVAYAYDTNSPKFFWMSERFTGAQTSAPPALFMLPASEDGTKPAKVDVQLEGCGGNFIAEDLAPWVFPNGNHILFHARCSKEEPSALYQAALTPAGTGFQAPAQKIKLAKAAVAQTEFRTPSLSPNRCQLFFEADNGIYRASRR